MHCRTDVDQKMQNAVHMSLETLRTSCLSHVLWVRYFVDYLLHVVCPWKWLLCYSIRSLPIMFVTIYSKDDFSKMKKKLSPMIFIEIAVILKTQLPKSIAVMNWISFVLNFLFPAMIKSLLCMIQLFPIRGTRACHWWQSKFCVSVKGFCSLCHA